ncbi:MAG: hypothetical protein OJF60_003179 [Burkholderiaceae bacterium]|nr:MAG: hypothetical protein OJF60_003179 [Burkholderiaceae bacterium]
MGSMMRPTDPAAPAAMPPKASRHTNPSMRTDQDNGEHQ